MAKRSILRRLIWVEVHHKMTSVFKYLLCLAAVTQLSVRAGASPLERVAVIGASASSGFVLSEPFGGTNTDSCRLSHYLDAAIVAPHQPPKNLSSPLFFLSPEAIATQEIEACTNGHPSLVVAVDFLFWFCYGEGNTDADRAARFEVGLQLLERIPCPLVVGDIPDASLATNSGILSIAQVPSETARQTANQRLRQWAATRPDVTVVPLDKFMAAVKANAAINGRKISVTAGKTYALLQTDRLHPNSRGAALLSLGILDTFASRHPEQAKETILWDLDTVHARGMEAALASKRSLASSLSPEKSASLQ